MPGKEGIPQLVLLRLYQRFVGRKCAIMLLGQKVISQLTRSVLSAAGQLPIFPRLSPLIAAIKRRPVLSLSLLIRCFSPKLKSKSTFLPIKPLIVPDRLPFF